MAAKLGNVAGAVGVDGFAFVMVSLRDEFGSGTFVVGTDVARAMAKKIIAEADAADETARKVRGE